MIAGCQTDRERGNAPDREQDNEQQLHPFARVELLLLPILLDSPLVRSWRPSLPTGAGGRGGLETENGGRACLTGS